MSYEDIYGLSTSTVYRQRCTVAMVGTAINISSEDDQTANHANRLLLANAVLNNPNYYTELMITAVAKFAVGDTDADIDNAVSSIWDAYANSYSSLYQSPVI